MSIKLPLVTSVMKYDDNINMCMLHRNSFLYACSLYLFSVLHVDKSLNWMQSILKDSSPRAIYSGKNYSTIFDLESYVVYERGWLL